MGQFLIATVPVYGHVKPLIPIACELIQRGHQVCWHTGIAFKRDLEDKGIQFEPIQSWLDYSVMENIPDEITQRRSSLQGVEQLKFDLKYIFIQPVIGQVQDLQTILKKFPADVLLTDSFFKGGLPWHELGGPIWAEYSVSPLSINSRDTAPFGLGLHPMPGLLGRLRNQGLGWLSKKLVFQDVLAEMNRVRSQLNLPETKKNFFDEISPYLYLAGTVPSFEYLRRDLPPQVHFVGPYLPNLSITEKKSDDSKLKPLKVVHITQGTIATNPSNLIIPALEALKDESISIVVTTGVDPSQELLETYRRENIRIERFIPYQELLPEVDLMITNGGYNGVQVALAHGIPLIVAGVSEDKREVNARVSWAGVGIDLKTNQPSPQKIKATFRQIIQDPNYLKAARNIQADMLSVNQAKTSADLLEKLVADSAVQTQRDSPQG